MSCQVSDIDFSWQLAEDGDGTGITVTADMPADLADLVGVLSGRSPQLSLTALVRLAEAEHAAQPNAEIPVMSRPTSSDWMLSVPS